MVAGPADASRVSRSGSCAEPEERGSARRLKRRSGPREYPTTVRLCACRRMRRSRLRRRKRGRAAATSYERRRTDRAASPQKNAPSRLRSRRERGRCWRSFGSPVRDRQPRRLRETILSRRRRKADAFAAYSKLCLRQRGVERRAQQARNEGRREGTSQGSARPSACHTLFQLSAWGMKAITRRGMALSLPSFDLRHSRPHAAFSSKCTVRPRAVAMFTSASIEKRETRPRNRSLTRGCVIPQRVAAST